MFVEKTVVGLMASEGYLNAYQMQLEMENITEYSAENESG